MATLPDPRALHYPTAEEIRSVMLAQYRRGHALKGVIVNVAEGSEPFIRFDAWARQAAHAIRNGQISRRALDPSQATGDDLIAWANVFGVPARPASPATGFIKITVVAPGTSVTIPTGFTGTLSKTGIKHEVISGGSVADQGSIQVRAKSAGSATNAAEGDVFTWDSAGPAYLKQAALVDVGGLDGGEDADNEDDLRRRLLRKLGLPAVGGNPAHTIQLAEEASAAVWAAFDYSAVRGPGSYDVAIMGDPSSTGGPVLNSTVQTTVETYVREAKPGFANINLTSIVLEEVDVVVNLALPLPKAAGGLGGGWKDAAPWPSTADGSTLPTISSPTTVTTLGFTVASTSADPPTPGKQIAIWNPTTLSFVEGSIVTVTGSSGAYIITTDVAASVGAFVTAGMYVSPAAHLMQSYADTLVAAMRDLGPGEKTDNVDILVHSRRQPLTSFSNPASLTSRQLSAIETTHDEVEGIGFAARYATGTTTTLTTPSVPSTTTEAPRRLSLKHLAFRRQA